MKAFQLKYAFSALLDTANVRIPLKDPQTGNLNDEYLQKYDSVFASFLYKRKITRDQIWPKIHIIQPKTEQQKRHLNYQTLYPLKIGMNQKLMQKLVKEDPSALNSNYVISIFCENSFKAMMDEYVDKVLICGKAPKNYEQQQEVEQQVKDLFKVYYFGQQITPLQRQIQLKYLSLKQIKFNQYHTILRNGMKNEYKRCKWRQQDQRILEDFVNWHKDDHNNQDINYRPYFQPLNLLSRLQPVKKLYSLKGTGNFMQAINFNRQIKPYYEKKPEYYEFVAKKIYIRILHWLNSIEFTNLLKIPPDFLIEQSIKHIHVWLIASRLKQIDTKTSRYLANLIEQLFKKDTQLITRQKTSKKGQMLVKNLNQVLATSNQYLAMHFRQSSITKNNHYLGIDSLVWTIAFLQKVQRYSDMVYLFGEYLLKNFQVMKTFSQQDIFNGMVQFDVYVIDPKFKEIILKANPQMNKEQFQIQFNSDKSNKKYYYSEVQKEAKFPLQYLKEKAKKNQISLFELIVEPIQRFFKKYTNLQTMDHFNQMEKQKKESIQKDKKSNWKTETDNINEVKKDFQSLSKIRSKRKNYSNIKTKTKN